MAEVERIAHLLEETFEGKPYYGPSVLAALEGVPAAAAALASRGNVRSIWAIVAHLTAELHYAHDMIEGTAGPWIEGETTWPAVIDTSDRSWQQAVHALKQANRALVDKIRTLDDGILDKEVSPVRRPLYIVLHGTIQHGVYHAGQISLLRSP